MFCRLFMKESATGWKSTVPRLGYCDNSAYLYGLTLFPPWGQEGAEQHAPTRRQRDLGTELPHLAEVSPRPKAEVHDRRLSEGGAYADPHKNP